MHNYLSKNIFFKIFALIIIILYIFCLKDKEKNIAIINEDKNKSVDNKELNNSVQDNITLVTTLYKIKDRRHKFEEYLKWVENLLRINKPIIFFIQPGLLEIIKEKRPKIYENKTIWIERNFSDLYAYKNYLQQFKDTYIIDKAKYKHSIGLYIIWSEKVNFLKEAIEHNYFKSKYFFWVDAGLFRNDEEIESYIYNWPSIEKLEKDPRVTLNGIRKITKEELDKLMNFDNITHDKYMNDVNVAGGFFGGRFDYLIEFRKFYYEVLELFYKNNKYIGTDQNLFAIVGKLHPEIANIIISGDYSFLYNYFIP